MPNSYGLVGTSPGTQDLWIHKWLTSVVFVDCIVYVSFHKRLVDRVMSPLMPHACI